MLLNLIFFKFYFGPKNYEAFLNASANRIVSTGPRKKLARPDVAKLSSVNIIVIYLVFMFFFTVTKVTSIFTVC